jgi:hypothetical protein
VHHLPPHLEHWAVFALHHLSAKAMFAPQSFSTALQKPSLRHHDPRQPVTHCGAFSSHQSSPEGLPLQLPQLQYPRPLGSAGGGRLPLLLLSELLLLPPLLPTGHVSPFVTLSLSIHPPAMNASRPSGLSHSERHSPSWNTHPRSLATQSSQLLILPQRTSLLIQSGS